MGPKEHRVIAVLVRSQRLGASDLTFDVPHAGGDVE
jgi:hypothetical protein